MFEGKRSKELQTYNGCDQKEFNLMPANTNRGQKQAHGKIK